METFVKFISKYNDKALHFLLMYFGSSIALLFVNIVVVALSVVLLAIGKEVYDDIHKETHSVEQLDTIASLMGGLLGIAVMIWRH